MHAELSPSAHHRWGSCPGSVVMERGLPNLSTPHAREGTAAHTLFERCLVRRVNADAFLGELIVVEGQKFIADEVMVTELQKCVDVANGFRKDAKYFAAETRVCIDHITGEPGASGTADVIAVVGDTLIVYDLKYGMGHKVHAKRNGQLVLYAAGVYRELSLVHDITRVRVCIHQPRLNHLDEHEYTVDEFLAFADSIRVEADRTREPNAPRIPSDDACRWCKAKQHNVCPTLREEVAKAAAVKLTELPGKLERLGADKLMVPLVRQWCDAVDELAQAEALAGNKIPHHKLVLGKPGDRKYIDQAAVEAQVTQQYDESLLYKKTFLTPPNLEKLIGKDAIKPLVKREPGRPTLVHESDKREEYSSILINALDLGGK